MLINFCSMNPPTLLRQFLQETHPTFHRYRQGKQEVDNNEERWKGG